MQSRRRFVASLGAVLAGSGCIEYGGNGSGNGERLEIGVGSMTLAEQYVLAEMFYAVLSEKTPHNLFKEIDYGNNAQVFEGVTQKRAYEQQDAADRLRTEFPSDDMPQQTERAFHVYPDYTGTMWQANPPIELESLPTPGEQYEATKEQIESEYDLEILDMTPFERVQAVHVVDLDGRVVESTSKDTGESVTDKPYGQPFGFNRLEAVKIRGPYTNKNSSTVVAAVSPVVQQIGQVLVLEISAADVTDEFSSGIDGTFTDVVRPTAGGTEILFSNRPGTTGQPYVSNRSQSEIPEVSEATPDGSFRENATKNPHLDDSYVVAYAQVEDEDWVLIKHAPAANAYRLKTDIQRGFLFFVGMALLGVVIVGGTLGRNTARAVRNLSRQATEVKNGNYDIELQSRRQDEIGQLTDSIREMRDALRRRIRTIQHHNEQLQVLDRLLRHNLKNDMNAIKLHAQMTAEIADGQPVEHAAEIDTLSDKLLDKTDKQRIITKTLAPGTRQKTTDIATLLRQSVDTMADRWPEAELTLQAPERAPVEANPYIGTALRELIENAISHIDSPEIGLTVDRSEETVTVEVADNGPGIPAVDQRILLGNQDIDPLNHGTGIGLWLVHWVVRQSDGTIDYEETDPHGSVISIELPASETES